MKVNLTREFRVFYNRRLKIVYEDDDIIVINKGYGLLSMGNDKVTDGTAYSILKEYVKWGNPANKIFIVHRLDRDTSGLMMFAKNENAKNAMQHNWNNMVLNRRYVAVVEGEIDPAEGTIRSYLAENTRHEVYSTDNPDEGKLAVTRYSTIAKGKGYSLVDVELDTGRKKPDSRTPERKRMPDCRRPPLRSRLKPNPQTRPSRPHSALRPPCHKKRNELLDTDSRRIPVDG